MLSNHEMLNQNETMQRILSLIGSILQKREKNAEKFPSLVNCKGMLFLHKIMRSEIVKNTQEKMMVLNKEALLHPSYSPDLALSSFQIIATFIL